MPYPYPPTTEPTISASSPITASLVAPIPVPTYGEGGSFAVISKTRVSALPLEIMNLVRDTTNWPKWNTFCPHGTIRDASQADLKGEEGDGIVRGNEGWVEVGSTVFFYVHMNGDGLVEGKLRSRTQEVRCTVLEKIDERKENRKGYRIAWKSLGFSGWQLKSERVMEFIEIEMEGKVGTDYTCWETFGGLIAPIVKMTVGSQLVDRFGDYARDLKEYFEPEDKKSVSVTGSGRPSMNKSGESSGRPSRRNSH